MVWSQLSASFDPVTAHGLAPLAARFQELHHRGPRSHVERQEYRLMWEELSLLASMWILGAEVEFDDA